MLKPDHYYTQNNENKKCIILKQKATVITIWTHEYMIVYSVQSNHVYGDCGDARRVFSKTQLLRENILS